MARTGAGAARTRVDEDACSGAGWRLGGGSAVARRRLGGGSAAARRLGCGLARLAAEVYGQEAGAHRTGNVAPRPSQELHTVAFAGVNGATVATAAHAAAEKRTAQARAQSNSNHDDQFEPSTSEHGARETRDDSVDEGLHMPQHGEHDGPGP